MTEKEHDIHVSGHPYRDELKRMYELTRPQIAVPVHGEAMHIHEHAKLAREWGAKTAFEPQNGNVICLPQKQNILIMWLQDAWQLTGMHYFQVIVK